MKNLEVAEKLNKMAELLELNEVEFKPRAYRKAAMTIESLTDDIAGIAEQNKLEDLPGIGKNIAQKIKDIIKTGTFRAYEDLKKKTPVDVDALEAIEGLGPKTVKKLYKQLGVKNLKGLEKAAKKGRIRNIEGLGPVVEKNILKGIELSKKGIGRVLLGFALPSAQEIGDRLKKLKEVKQISIAGSLRRRKETIGDVDILITSSKPKKVMDFFTSMNEVADVMAKGSTKSSVRLDNGIQVDLRVVEDKSFGAAMQYFTGSQAHNIHLRKIAIQKNLKLSEYGLFNKKGKAVAGKTEQDVYKKLGLSYIEPELREDNGEVEAAQQGKLPKLVSLKDIQGDLHVHTNWSDGSESIENMANAAKMLGYKYIAVTDHTGNLKIANSLDEKRMLKQIIEIERINKKSRVRILAGAEVNIKENGSLDLSNSVLKKLDFVIAAIHSGFKNPQKKIMKRLTKAMENNNVDAIAHPTGRKIGRREPIDIDFDRLFEKAKETNTALEINAWPERLDLNDVNIKAAVEAGVNLVIGTDSHSIEQLNLMEFGIATARRGWCEKENISNTLSVEKLLKKFA